MKKVVLVGLIAVLSFSCKQAKKEAVPTVAEVQKPVVKLYTFNGGTVGVNKLELFSQDTTYQGQTKEFADPFYVISHPKGNLMWDAGLPEMLVGQDPYTDPSGAFTVSRQDSVLHQLKSIGMTPDDVQYVALSHTHFDHTGHANVMHKSTWLVQGSEYDMITSDEIRNGENAGLYEAIKELKNVKKLEGDYDVFGDGTVVIKSMPGHTPGHQVLYLELVEHGPLLLTGDLYHLYENREYKRVPSFNHDVDQTLASMDAFEAFAKEKDAKVYLQHQKEDFNKMPKAPEYLK
ncbi:N-acyl homoserine lactonase family protein [Maribacter chungangensis]|uniref:N-acyl homoserine lactonase family protein n=1 Tax=Maribacter chungangensis TaxID=1069117 RepID=A0ABW3AYK0_9FLAO